MKISKQIGKQENGKKYLHRQWGIYIKSGANKTMNFERFLTTLQSK